MAGLSIVLDLWHHQSINSIWGIILVFIAALATVSRMYVFGHQTKERHPIVVGAENFLITAILITFTVLYALPHPPITILGATYTVSGCIALVLATFGMFYGISLLGSFQWSLFSKLEPVFTALSSALFLKEFLKPAQYLGIFVVVGSLLIYQIVDHRRRTTGIKQDMAPIQ